MAECHVNGQKNRIRHITERTFQVSLIFSVGVAGIFVAFSYEIGTIVYGSTEAAEHLRVLAPLIPLMYLDGAVDSILKGMGEQLYSMKVNITDSLVGILMIVILLPCMGIRGYRIVLFVCEALNASLSILKLLEVTKLHANPLKWLAKPLISVILATFLSRAFVDSSLFTACFNSQRDLLFSAITLTSLLYLGITLLFGCISREDLRWAKGILKTS
jgi:stage V sporulation protein B